MVVRLSKKDIAMVDYKLLIDLPKQGYRQGPGGDAETEQALNLAMIDRAAPLKVADIGCGTGASALLLARFLNAQITAVDFLQDFLDVLNEKIPTTSGERSASSVSFTPGPGR